MSQTPSQIRRGKTVLDENGRYLCEYCGHRFNRYNQRKTGVRFCSKSCLVKWRIENTDCGYKKGNRPWNVNQEQEALFSSIPVCDVIQIPLGRGLFCQIDRSDFALVSQYKWHPSGTSSRARGPVYAVTTLPRVPGLKHQPHIIMHRLICDAPENMEVDHINGDGLDNRRANLRVCSGADNVKNVPGVPKTSKYKGVSWWARHRKWRAGISVNYRYHFLGAFDDEIQAAYAYDEAAICYHGEFAWLNFPERQISMSALNQEAFLEYALGGMSK